MATPTSDQPDSHYRPLHTGIPAWLGQASTTKRQALSRSKPQPFQASATQHAELKRLNGVHWNAQNVVDDALRHVQGPQAFARTVLEDALLTQFSLDLDSAAFWTAAAGLFARFAPRNAELLKVRDDLQARIDARAVGLSTFRNQILHRHERAAEGYLVRRDGRRFARLAVEIAREVVRIAVRYGALKRDYRAAYEQMVSDEAWDARFVAALSDRNG